MINILYNHKKLHTDAIINVLSKIKEGDIIDAQVKSMTKRKEKAIKKIQIM